MSRSLVVRRLATGAIVCAGCFALGSWQQRRVATPVLSVPLPSMQGPAIDTAVALPAVGRYRLALDFKVPPGDERRQLMDADPLVEWKATVGALTVRSGDIGTGGIYGGGGSFGLILTFLTSEADDTLRLQLRSLDSLDTRRRYAPTVLVEHDHLRQMKALYRATVLQLVGLLALLIGVGSAIAAARRSRSSGVAQ